MSGEVWEVWGAYHERERLCPEGVRVGNPFDLAFHQLTVQRTVCIIDIDRSFNDPYLASLGIITFPMDHESLWGSRRARGRARGWG